MIWAIEAGVWMAVGAAVGFGMDPIEGCYIVALASVFALIPSGPGYAGTQDAAVTIGIKALGGRARTAVSYLLMLRFVIVVPITVLGLILLAPATAGCRNCAPRALKPGADDDRDRSLQTPTDDPRRPKRRRTPAGLAGRPGAA